MCGLRECAGRVTLSPYNSALCYVNGKMIVDETLLKTGSRVIFGKSHVFRFTNPQQGNSTHFFVSSCNNNNNKI